MDLLGKKARAEADALRQFLALALKSIDRAIDQRKELDDATKQIADLEKELAVAQEQVKFLKTQRDQLALQAPSWSPHPLHSSEEEEDARFASEVGLLDKKELEDILKSTGFENTEIEFN